MSYTHFAGGPLSSSSSPAVPRMVPAQLAYLAIYNPALGPTDETFGDQLVYYYSRVAHEARLAARKSARNDGAGGDALRREENEKLRRIGLVQGMIGFARTFTNGESIDAIETEKTRAVVLELEPGWWIVASVDLTQLPASTTSASSNAADTRTSKPATKTADQPKQEVEYSAREVSPPALLRQHLLQAHRVFALHHGPSLNLLYSRLGREKLSNALDRFWTSFVRRWNVLLHGNPAADIFDGLKVASGGELGFGVGEEEWGSGERDVLEDLVRRTEGLVDLVVSRFGEPELPPHSQNTAAYAAAHALPWMGSGNAPISTDGVVFGGTGALSRAALRDVSQWMRQVYTYGEHAYGVRDNPLRERRKRRKRDSTHTLKGANGGAVPPEDVDEDQTKAKSRQENSKRRLNSGESVQKDDQVARKDYATVPDSTTPIITIPPAIPPPIVSAAQQALENATQKVDSKKQSAPPTPGDEGGTTLGIPDQYMKYLTFGLSTLAKPSSSQRPTAASRTSTASQSSVKGTAKSTSHAAPLTIVDPIPDGDTLAAKIARQKRLENQGHFVIGLKGDLDEPVEREGGETSAEDSQDDSQDSRTVLRTLYVEVNSIDGDGDSESRLDRPGTLRRSSDMVMVDDPKVRDRYRLRAVVYVRRPFIYCFLFQNQTASLQYSHFYRELHRELLPIHKPLLSSTDATDVAARIEASHVTTGGTTASRSSQRTNELPNRGFLPEGSDIYDLLYNPHTLTLHTSIPNIPDPGTPAAEGIVEGRSGAMLRHWTRIDALNVHHQILQTFVGVQRRPEEVERTSKTNRGWWIVWMRVPPPMGEAAVTAGSSVSNWRPSATASPDAGTPASQSMESVTTVIGKDDGLRPSSARAPSSDHLQVPSASSTRREGSQDATKAHPASVTSSTTAAATAPGPVELWRTAFLVRKANEANSSSSASYARSISGGDGISGGGPPRGLFAGFPGLSAFRGAGDGVDEAASSAATRSLSPLPMGPRTDERARRGSSASGASLTGGIGFDARRYVEGLMSLNR